jgi:hypothetical protein
MTEITRIACPPPLATTPAPTQQPAQPRPQGPAIARDVVTLTDTTKAARLAVLNSKGLKFPEDYVVSNKSKEAYPRHVLKSLALGGTIGTVVGGAIGLAFSRATRSPAALFTPVFAGTGGLVGTFIGGAVGGGALTRHGWKKDISHEIGSFWEGDANQPAKKAR